jgi:hypothetical protein
MQSVYQPWPKFGVSHRPYPEATYSPAKAQHIFEYLCEPDYPAMPVSFEVASVGRLHVSQGLSHYEKP